MLPRYKNHCCHQEQQFDGTDLAKKQRKEIYMRAPEISNDSIQSLGNGCFYVQSTMDLAKMYLVDLSKDHTSVMSTGHLIDYSKETCDCPDWLSVQLCKHIAAIAHFHTEKTNVPNPAPQVHERSRGDSSMVSNASAIPILEMMISVSRDYLSDGLPSLPGIVWSL